MDFEAALRQSFGEKELELEINKKIESFHGLLTREAAMRLIAKEKGLLKQEEKVYTLAEIPKGARKFGFAASVKKIWPVARYSSGKKSRVVEISDGTDVKPLVLWNDDAELAKGLRSRDEIVVRGAYEKSGELHLGYSGRMEIASKAPFSELGELEDGTEAHLRGVVSRIEGYDRFVINGRAYRGFSFFITDGRNERRCVLTEGADRAEKLKQGDEVLIEDGFVRNGNVEIRHESRILSRRKADMLMGEIRKIECADDSLGVDVGGNEVSLDRENALRFVGVEVADDIALSTVAALKKDKLLNSRIAVRIERRNGRIIIR